MEDVRKQAQAVPADIDTFGACPPIRQGVTLRRNAAAGAAMQYLAWALEEIENDGLKKAAQHTRAAMAALRKGAAAKD